MYEGTDYDVNQIELHEVKNEVWGCLTWGTAVDTHKERK